MRTKNILSSLLVDLNVNIENYQELGAANLPGKRWTLMDRARLKQEWTIEI